MSKLEACKLALEKQENEYRSLIKEHLEFLWDLAIYNQIDYDEALDATLKRLTDNKILTKGVKVLDAKKKFNEEKSMQVPTIYPKPLMDAVERGEIENLTKYPYFSKHGMKFRVTGFTSKSLFFYWSEKEGLMTSYEIAYSNAPQEIFNRIKKEMESEK